MEQKCTNWKGKFIIGESKTLLGLVLTLFPCVVLTRTNYSCCAGMSSLSSVQVPMKSSKSKNRQAPHFNFDKRLIMQQMIVIQIVFLWSQWHFFQKVVASNDSGEIQAGTGDLVVSSMGKWSLNGAISSNPWNWNGRWVVTYARRFTTLALTNFSNRSRETKDSESNKSPFDIILYQHLAASHP